MRRILWILFGCFLVLGFAWTIATLPGRISVRAGTYSVDTSLPVAVALLLAAFLLIYALARVLLWIWRVPRSGSGWRSGRRRRNGDQAVTRALVALAAGEKADARRESARARSLLGETPQTLLLAAEAGRLSGRDDEAEEALKRLAARKDASFLGLRGLLASAIARGQWTEAAALARQAETAHPGASWLRQERAQLAIRAGDWGAALTLAGAGGPKAALAVGAAQVDANPDRAEKLLRQALKDDPSFTPAVLARAGLMRGRNQEKRAQAVLAEGWARLPHPDIAAFALAPAVDKAERLRIATQLIAGAPSHPESNVLLARVSLEAGSLGDARYHWEAARQGGLDQRRVWLLLAEIEEEERGDTEAGRTAQRDALRRAANADNDPEWRCSACHTPLAGWRAACPACLTPGSVAWLVENGPVPGPVISHAG